jgi:hypothetical protein
MKFFGCFFKVVGMFFVGLILLSILGHIVSNSGTARLSSNTTNTTSSLSSLPADDAPRIPLTSSELRTATLDVAPDSFTWNDWAIKINKISFSNSVTPSFSAKQPDADSVFVYLDLTVKNTSPRGSAFVPQNAVKIIIGKDAFDAEDIDPEFKFMKNIEPTLVRQRACYFEVPKALLPKVFALQFSSLFSSGTNVAVTAITH